MTAARTLLPGTLLGGAAALALLGRPAGPAVGWCGRVYDFDASGFAQVVVLGAVAAAVPSTLGAPRGLAFAAVGAAALAVAVSVGAAPLAFAALVLAVGATLVPREARASRPLEASVVVAVLVAAGALLLVAVWTSGFSGPQIRAPVVHAEALEPDAAGALRFHLLSGKDVSCLTPTGLALSESNGGAVIPLSRVASAEPWPGQWTVLRNGRPLGDDVPLREGDVFAVRPQGDAGQLLWVVRDLNTVVYTARFG